MIFSGTEAEYSWICLGCVLKLFLPFSCSVCVWFGIQIDLGTVSVLPAQVIYLQLFSFAILSELR